MMKLFLMVSFLALSDAWLWGRRYLPFKRDNLASKGLEQGGPGGPLKEIVGNLQDLIQGLAAVNQRADELEEQLGELESALLRVEDGETTPDGSDNPEPTADLSRRSDETAVRMLLQQLESRLNKKTSEQKQVN